MAAGVRSDCRIARAGASARTKARTRGRHRDRRDLQPQNRKNGCADLYVESARDGHIAVALTGRGRGQLHRLRGISTRIRALVHEEVDASTVTPLG
jgi:hypothetical protein